MENEHVKLSAVLALLRDDGAAMSCQSLGQYRSRLIRGVVAVAAAQRAERNASGGCSSSCCIEPGLLRDPSRASVAPLVKSE